MTHLGGRWRVAILGALYLASVLVAARKIRPFQSGSVGPDAAAPVIEFQRLTAGQAVEGHLTQTSKPVIDLVYGPLFGLFHDWRPIAWAAIFAFALCVVLATLLAHRVGGLASAAFAAAAFLLSPILLVDISLAYAIVWMLLFLLVAGLAVTAERPRFGLAGLALMLAALARPEALAVVGVAAVALIGAEVWAIRKHRPRPPRRAYLVLLGFLAVPVFLAHDFLLFGDPLFWAKTAQINSEGRRVRGLVAMIVWMCASLPRPGAAPSAGRRRGLDDRRSPTVGPGHRAGGSDPRHRRDLRHQRCTRDGRHRALSRPDRPRPPVRVGGRRLGARCSGAPSLGRTTPAGPGSRRSLLPVIGGLAVALAIAPMWPLDPAARAYAEKQVQLHANARRAFEAIRRELRDPPSWRGLPASKAISAHPLVIVPPTLRAQAVADLDLPLTEVAYSYARSLNPALGLPTAGTIVYHDRLDDAPVSSPRYTQLEIDQPTDIGAYRYVPILVDARAGFWVLRVEDAATP